MTPPHSGLPASDVAVMHCAQCGWSVREGPRGGYVCTQCFHTVEPPRDLDRAGSCASDPAASDTGPDTDASADPDADADSDIDVSRSAPPTGPADSAD